MAEQPGARHRGRAVLAGILALGAIGAAGPLALHFGQKRHNILPFDVEARFPAAQRMAGGEVFATTIIAIMEHELDSTTGWRPNDFVLWGPRSWADNNANRQLGIIQAVRES